MIPKFLGILLGSRFHNDELAMECMSILEQSQVEFRQDPNSRLSGSYLHCSCQMLQEKKSLTSSWNSSLLEDLELKGRFKPKSELWILTPTLSGGLKTLTVHFVGR